MPRMRSKLGLFVTLLVVFVLCISYFSREEADDVPSTDKKSSVNPGKHDLSDMDMKDEDEYGNKDYHDDDEDEDDEDEEDEEDEDDDIDVGELEEIFVESDEDALELFKNPDISDVDLEMSTPPSAATDVDDDEEKSVWDKADQMNVLFIMTDDMRPQLGVYQGEDYPAPYMKRKMFTPNLDRLAESSLVLKRAYVQYSLCGPSRTSLLTSRRPDTTRIFGNNNYWRDKGGNFTTLPQYFTEHGYISRGYGKIFHKGRSSNKNDKAYSWSQKYYMPPYTDRHYIPGGDEGAGWKSVSAKERQKIPLSDEYSVAELKKDLTAIAPDAIKGRKHFFYALGFKKPHLSLICPEEHYHLYPLEQDEVYMPDEKWQTPSVKSTVELGEDDGATAEHLRVIPDEVIRHLRRAYFACVSFVDSLIGKVVKHLEKVGLANNTIVVFMADHGYHLGENDHWGKVTNYERATHVPMFIRIPGKTDKGVSSRALVEALDMYPTIVEAAGLGKIPACPRESSTIRACTEGKSLLPLVDNPAKIHKKAVVSQIASGGQFMSYTIRTDRYRYIDWAEVKKKPRDDGLWDIHMDWTLTGWPWWTALYDRKIDPEERFNRTGDPQYRRVETKLRNHLHTFVGSYYQHPKVFVKGH